MSDGPNQQNFYLQIRREWQAQSNANIWISSTLYLELERDGGVRIGVQDKWMFQFFGCCFFFVIRSAYKNNSPFGSLDGTWESLKEFPAISQIEKYAVLEILYSTNGNDTHTVRRQTQKPYHANGVNRNSFGRTVRKKMLNFVVERRKNILYIFFLIVYEFLLPFIYIHFFCFDS